MPISNPYTLAAMAAASTALLAVPSGMLVKALWDRWGAPERVSREGDQDLYLKHESDVIRLEREIERDAARLEGRIEAVQAAYVSIAACNNCKALSDRSDQAILEELRQWRKTQRTVNEELFRRIEPIPTLVHQMTRILEKLDRWNGGGTNS